MPPPPQQCEELSRPPAAFWLLLIIFVAALAFFARLFRRRFFGGGPPPLPGAPPAPPTLLLSLFQWSLRPAAKSEHDGFLNAAQVDHLAAGATAGVQQALAFALLTLVVMATDPVARILYALFVCREPRMFRSEGRLVTLYYAGASLLFGATEARIFAATNWVGAVGAYAAYALATGTTYTYAGPVGACALGEAAWGLWLAGPPTLLAFVVFGCFAAFVPLLLLLAFRTAGRSDSAWVTLLVVQAALVIVCMALGHNLSLDALRAAQAHGMCVSGSDAAAAAAAAGSAADSVSAVAASFSRSSSSSVAAMPVPKASVVQGALPHVLLVAGCAAILWRWVAALSLLRTFIVELTGKHAVVPPFGDLVTNEWLALHRNFQTPIQWRNLVRGWEGLGAAQGFGGVLLQLARRGVRMAVAGAEEAVRRAFIAEPLLPGETAATAAPTVPAVTDDYDILVLFDRLLTAVTAGSTAYKAVQGALAANSLAVSTHCTRVAVPSEEFVGLNLSGLSLRLIAVGRRGPLPGIGLPRMHTGGAGPGQHCQRCQCGCASPYMNQADLSPIHWQGQAVPATGMLTLRLPGKLA